MAIQNPAKYGVVDSIVHNTLFLPGAKPEFKNYVLKGGQKLKANSVLGRVTATGKLVLSKAAAGDGSQNPIAILTQAVNTYDVDGVTARDTPMSVVVRATVNGAALVLGDGHTLATVDEPLRVAGILVGNAVYSG